MIEYAPALNIAPPPMIPGVVRTPAFLPQLSTRSSSFATITDGLSNTMMFGELSGGPVRYNQNRQVGSQSPNQFHLGTWARLLPIRMSDDGTTLHGGNCLINCTNFTGVNLYSFHVGMVHVALADGSVRAVTNSISMDNYYRLVAVNDGLVVGEY